MIQETKVYHELLKRLDISISEYCVIDAIHREQVSNNNWCKLNILELAKDLGLSKTTVYNLIDSITEKKLLQAKTKTSGMYQATNLWINALSAVYLDAPEQDIQTQEYSTAFGFSWLNEDKEESQKDYPCRIKCSEKNTSIYMGAKISKHLAIRKGSRVDVGFKAQEGLIALRTVKNGGYSVQSTTKSLQIVFTSKLYPFGVHDFILFKDEDMEYLKDEQMVVVKMKSKSLPRLNK